ncbi:probable RNA-binding protein EIF1AD [Hemiscyllium ocellatum]|uniref:probable RNA-binding protein EIF1AD n=1 Tax=Hemiscyllium ocellatum TaxID=170820 RepID=UPI002966D4FD|nr:probable RNA-binding protein EIF1AD [Hemiscyllium ocellatum]
MSQATKRKHVVKEVLGDYEPPSEIQQIVRVLGSPGNNLHEVETAQGDRFLASMPTKFRKNIWIKRGDFLIVDPIQEGEKVKAEINSILYKEHIKQFRKDGLWPASFCEPATECPESNTKKDGSNCSSEEEAEEEDSEDDSNLFVNTNRRNYEYSESDEEDDEEEQQQGD